MSPLVCVILVNWNGKADTLACLESLADDRYAAKRVIVVDNGSTDGSADALREQHPWAEVIEAGANLGFTGANNLGLRHAIAAGAEYIYLLNNDTVSEPEALTALVDAATSATTLGLFAPVVHYFDPPREAWFAGSRLELGAGVAVHDNSSVPRLEDPTRDVPWVSGCAVLARADLLQALGGLDDRYFLNWEDVDLSLRARRAGHRVFLVPAARVYHKVGRSFASAGTDGWYYHVRNRLLLAAEHGEGFRPLLQTSIALQAVRRGAADAVRGRGGAALAAAIEAIADHAAGRYGPRRRRGRSAAGVRSGNGTSAGHTTARART